MNTLSVKSRTKTELIDITAEVQNIVHKTGVKEGMCFVYVPHTTAAVTINENADPSVRKDIVDEMNKIVPWDDNYAHMEGNSAAHIKATLFGATSAIPISKGRLSLGTWQGIYFCEFDGPRNREVLVQTVKSE
ncbi:MAG: YjbQ family protein [Candidatus Kuenenia sp.]|nr:YjbQ family protein [Candidatus Kuenenia hertensis]